MHHSKRNRHKNRIRLNRAKILILIIGTRAFLDRNLYWRIHCAT